MNVELPKAGRAVFGSGPVRTDSAWARLEWLPAALPRIAPGTKGFAARAFSGCRRIPFCLPNRAQPIDIEFVLKAVVGTASPLGVVTSLQEQVEWHLRIASLLVGLTVGVLSLVGMWRKLRKR